MSRLWPGPHWKVGGRVETPAPHVRARPLHGPPHAALRAKVAHPGPSMTVPRSSPPVTSQRTSRSAGGGTSTSVLTRRNAAGFTVSATLLGVSTPTSASPTLNERGPSRFPDAASFRDDIVRELVDRNYSTRKFKRGYEWDWACSSGFSNAIDSSLTAAPLDAPPPLSSDPSASYALSQYPDLFKIISPIDVDMFVFLLSDHPNRPFVDSVARGLCQGFWPMCELPSSSISFTRNHQVCDLAPDLLSKACAEELAADCYSPGFHTLLQGMKVSPLLLVEKKGTLKKRVCTDMSFGTPSLNDLVVKDKVRVSFDSLISWAPYLVELSRAWVPVVIWKSDVMNAYRILPMALAWQIRQIVCIDGLFHADCCANFGSAASPKLWCSFFSLVLWLARSGFGISRINNLMDDTWGVSPLSSMVSFRGHQVPLDQAKLLLLFDLLHIPWEWKKQLQGSNLEIFGFWVRSRDLAFSLPDDKKSGLVAALRAFTESKSKTLREWQSLLGWASWGLNVFPLGRWALQSSWEKISGKTYKHLVVPHNRAVQHNLRWLADRIGASDGNFLLQAQIWSWSDADFLCTVDACPSGMGIWLPNSQEGFHFQFPLPSRDIYWAELAAACHAVLLGIGRGAKKRLVCSDSSNTCDLFLSHRPVEKVRPLFSTVISHILDAGVDVRICHLSGKKNVFADALSRGELGTVRALISSACLSPLSAFSVLPDGGFSPASI